VVFGVFLCLSASHHNEFVCRNHRLQTKNQHPPPSAEPDRSVARRNCFGSRTSAFASGDSSERGQLAGAAAGVLNTQTTADLTDADRAVVLSARASLLQSLASLALPLSTAQAVEQQLQLLAALTMVPDQLNQAAVDAGSSFLAALTDASMPLSSSAAQAALTSAAHLLAAPGSSPSKSAYVMPALHGVTRAQLRSMVCGQQPTVTSVPGLTTSAAKLVVGQAAQIDVGQTRFALPASVVSSQAAGACYGAEAIVVDVTLNPYSYSTAPCVGVSLPKYFMLTVN
jgi:hypothetical protein